MYEVIKIKKEKKNRAVKRACYRMNVEVKRVITEIRKQRVTKCYVKRNKRDGKEKCTRL